MKLIVAATCNGILGRPGGVPWNCESDLLFFKALTLGCTCHVGYNTYPEVFHLKNRKFVVIDRDNPPFYEKSAVVIGGAKTYDAYMKTGWVDEIYYTEIYSFENRKNGDVLVPGSLDLLSLDNDKKYRHSIVFEKYSSSVDVYAITIHRFKSKPLFGHI